MAAAQIICLPLTSWQLSPQADILPKAAQPIRDCGCNRAGEEQVVDGLSLTGLTQHDKGQVACTGVTLPMYALCRSSCHATGDTIGPWAACLGRKRLSVPQCGAIAPAERGCHMPLAHQ